jgi:NifU-like protein
MVGNAGSLACARGLRIGVHVDPVTERITHLEVKVWGCGPRDRYTALVELFRGLTLRDALEVGHDEIARALGGLPEAQMHRAVLVHEALHAATRHQSGDLCGNGAEAETITCRCFAVEEAMIRRTVRMNGLTTPTQVRHYTGAAGSCGHCRNEVEAVLSLVNAEMVAEGRLDPRRAFQNAPKQAARAGAV